MFHINKIINQKNIKHITTLLPFGSGVVVQVNTKEYLYFKVFVQYIAPLDTKKDSPMVQ